MTAVILHKNFDRGPLYIRLTPEVDPGWFLDKITVLTRIRINKPLQTDPAEERTVWSGSTLFATYWAILHTLTGSKIDLLKKNIKSKGLNI